MSRNYREYSKPNKQNTEEPVIETPVEEILEAAEEVEVEVATNATVVDCKKLNVRKTPNKLAGIVATLAAGTSVVVDVEKSTIGFYKITAENGIEGYCVKDFIAIV